MEIFYSSASNVAASHGKARLHYKGDSPGQRECSMNTCRYHTRASEGDGENRKREGEAPQHCVPVATWHQSTLDSEWASKTNHGCCSIRRCSRHLRCSTEVGSSRLNKRIGCWRCYRSRLAGRNGRLPRPLGAQSQIPPEWSCDWNQRTPRASRRSGCRRCRRCRDPRRPGTECRSWRIPGPSSEGSYRRPGCSNQAPWGCIARSC